MSKSDITNVKDLINQLDDIIKSKYDQIDSINIDNPFDLEVEDAVIITNIQLEKSSFDLAIAISDNGNDFSCVIFEESNQFVHPDEHQRTILFWNLQSIPPTDEDWFTLLHELGHVINPHPLTPLLGEYEAWEWAIKNCPIDIEFPIDAVVNDLYEYHNRYGILVSKSKIRSVLNELLN